MKVITDNADEILFNKKLRKGCLCDLENGETARIMKTTPNTEIEVEKTVEVDNGKWLLGLRRTKSSSGHYQYLAFPIKK